MTSPRPLSAPRGSSASAAGRPRVAVLFDRFGPYHLARLNGAASRVDVHGIELNRIDDVYAWDRVDDGAQFQRYALFDRAENVPGFAALAATIGDLLDRIKPTAVAVPGWGYRLGLAALGWCRRRGAAAILMSESCAHDAPRRGLAERVKRRVVRQFSAALVGGAPHVEYLRQFGFPPERCFLGYDAVDNAYFARESDQARAEEARWREELQLPARYFLASCRFIEKKNLVRLVDAYAVYRQERGDAAWDLVILGDGPLRRAVEARMAERGVGQVVHLPGFKQYDELPKYFALATAFIHPSTVEQWGLVVNEAMACGLPVLVSETCGAAAELAHPGVNGWTFDPHSTEAMTAALAAADGQPGELGRLGTASRRIIAQWGPERFADGLLGAVELAAREGPPRVRVGDLALLRLLGAKAA